MAARFLFPGLLMLMAFTGCNFSFFSKCGDSTTTPGGQKVALQVRQKRGNCVSLDERQMVLSSIDLFEKIIRSKAFEDSVLHSIFFEQPPTGESRLEQNLWIVTDLRQHLDKLYHEELTIRIRARFLRYLSTTVGWSVGGTNRVTTFNKYFQGWKKSETHRGRAIYAGHLAHEFCHIAGYKHDEKPSPERQYTIPYRVGEIVERIALSDAWIEESLISNQ